MGKALALFVAFFLSSSCLIQAARQQSRTRLSMEAASSLEPEELQVVLAPSLAPSPQYPDSVPQDNVPTIPPAEMTEKPRETFSPLPSSTNPCLSSVSGVPSCSVRPLLPGPPILREGLLGFVGAETKLFRRKCKDFCMRHSRRRCWLVRKPRIFSRCKRFSFLGYNTAPSCCFYLHCINSRRPRGRSRSWWKYTSALRAIRTACK